MKMVQDRLRVVLCVENRLSSDWSCLGLAVTFYLGCKWLCIVCHTSPSTHARGGTSDQPVCHLSAMPRCVVSAHTAQGCDTSSVT